MGRKVFISYSHRLDQQAADDFANIFTDQRDVFIDKSVREDLGDLDAEYLKSLLRPQIADASVTIVLIGEETGGRAWVDWEIYNSLRKSFGNERNGLLGIYIPHKRDWVPKRLEDNVPTMGLIIDWPRDYRTLANAIEEAYSRRFNSPYLKDRVRQRNSTRSSW